MVFEYAVAGGGSFDDVRAWRLGSEINVPLWPEYVGVSPAEGSRHFFSVDQPNVDIVAVKTLGGGAFRGEVTSAPLSPKITKVFILRLQEFAGRGTSVKVTVPVRIKSATLMNITESVELSSISQIDPLTIPLRPYECATVRIEIQ